MQRSELKAGELATITYTKDNGERSTRVIIPTTVPSNIKALDVSDLPEDAREVVVDRYNEYRNYLQQHLKTAFTFEDWLSHSQGVTFNPKWRTFKPSQITTD